MATTKELLNLLNARRVADGKPALASWKQSRSKLEELLATDGLTITVDSRDILDEPATEEPEAEVDEPEADEPEVDEPELCGHMGTETFKPWPGKAPRGAIGALAMDLLAGTDKPYKEIVQIIVSTYPSARTTPRSLASVAMELRKSGVEVPLRRKSSTPSA